LTVPFHDFFKQYIAFAHIPVSNTSRIQEWTDSHNDINIQFIYEPERPIIDTFTELVFSIQNISTGNHIKDAEDTFARVVVTNGQRLYKFENMSVGNDGHFSVKYLFPDDGTHQVITRVDKKDVSSTAASFSVFVPHQSPPNILNPFPTSPGNGGNDTSVVISEVLAIILPVVAVVSLIYVLKRGKRSK